MPPPSIGPAPPFVFSNTSMGIPNPFGRDNIGHIWLQPDAGIDMLVHEAGHNRSYGTRPSDKLLGDGIGYTFQRLIETMRMEDLAEDNGWRLNSFMNPESRMSPEEWARHSDVTLRRYANSHDPQKSYLELLTRSANLGQHADHINAPLPIDGRNRYTPPQHSGLPGQPNWHRSEHYRENPECLEDLFR